MGSCQALLEARANPTIRNLRHQTALELACANGHEVLKAFVARRRANALCSSELVCRLHKADAVVDLSVSLISL